MKPYSEEPRCFSFAYEYETFAETLEEGGEQTVALLALIQKEMAKQHFKGL